MQMPPSAAEKARLYAIHCARKRATWGKKYDVSRDPWPQTDAEWRQTPHGAPWDTNVEMALFTLELGRTLLKEGLIP
jgi:hypothetical protein